jgi:L-cystine uptake protein TcyP (sodium:dicarboxylate symporter family)
MNMPTKILAVICFISLILLIVGNMRDDEKMSTAGLIGLVLGVLFMFTYNFLTFISNFK